MKGIFIPSFFFIFLFGFAQHSLGHLVTKKQPLGIAGDKSVLWPYDAKRSSYRIHICFDKMEAVDNDRRLLLKRKLSATWERYSTIDFYGFKRCSNKDNQIRVKIVNDDDTKKAGCEFVGRACSTVGRQKNGFTNVILQRYDSKTYADGSPWANQDVERAFVFTALHEFGHALGFKHEQQRPDSREDCLEESSSDDGVQLSATPYDADSIMNYCTPFWWQTLSAGDIAGLQRFYPRDNHRERQVLPSSGDKSLRPSSFHSFGEVMVSGDFTRDGIPDVAVSAATRAGDANVRGNPGSVYIYKGTELGGLVFHQRLQPDFATPEKFGASLAVGDFDGDGGDDLAVGAPGDAGRVYVYYAGHRGAGLQGARKTVVRNCHAASRPDNVEERTQLNFGATVAKGDFNGDGKDDLAVGYPNQNSGAGGICIFLTHTTQPRQFIRLPIMVKGPQNFTRYGEAITTLDYDFDGEDELVATVRSTGKNGGVVTTVANGTPSTLLSGLREFNTIQFVSGLGPSSRFKPVLITGRFMGFTNQVAFSAPGSGKVQVFGVDRAGKIRDLLEITSPQMKGEFDTTRFGTALAAANVLSKSNGDELVVGAPVESVDGQGEAAGTAYIYALGSRRASLKQKLSAREHLKPQFAQKPALFGFAIAGANLDNDKEKTDELIISAPFLRFEQETPQLMTFGVPEPIVESWYSIGPNPMPLP